MSRQGAAPQEPGAPPVPRLTFREALEMSRTPLTTGSEEAHSAAVLGDRGGLQRGPVVTQYRTLRASTFPPAAAGILAEMRAFGL